MIIKNTRNGENFLGSFGKKAAHSGLQFACLTTCCRPEERSELLNRKRGDNNEINPNSRACYRPQTKGGGGVLACLAGGNPACLAWGVSRPTPRGEAEGSGQGGLQAHTRVSLQAHTWGGSPDPHPGGSPGPYPGGLWTGMHSCFYCHWRKYFFGAELSILIS